MDGIATNYRLRPVAPARQPIAVDQYPGWLDAQRFDGARHCKQCRLQDIDPVDLLDRSLTDPDDASF